MVKSVEDFTDAGSKTPVGELERNGSDNILCFFIILAGAHVGIEGAYTRHVQYSPLNGAHHLVLLRDRKVAPGPHLNLGVIRLYVGKEFHARAYSTIQKEHADQ